MEGQVRFDDRVVIITGGGGGLGRAYALAFASRGGRVVVSDLAREAADKVVAEITAAGGTAIADYHGVSEGQLTVKGAIDAWGRLDVLVNNAGILRDRSFKQMTDAEWNAVYEVHLKGAYIITKAAWPIFRKQSYGRIIMTTSAAGLYGAFGQTNYSAAKFGLTSFAKTLAVEGAKYNIRVNSIAPIAASAMTASLKTADVLAQCTESGSIIETGAAWAAKLRWEASKGVIFRDDESFTPSADHLKSMYQQSSGLAPSTQGPPIDFNGQVAIVTGAGGGIGRAYAHMYAKMGASVVVNDMAKANADSVVQEIISSGGIATASYASVEDGAAIVAVAVKAYGTVNNAGILRDKSFAAMSDKEWDVIFGVHLGGTRSVIKAAWPHMVEQKYGRILNTASLVCMHGNFGQANYSTAKGAIVGFTKSLAIEGRKYGILANVLLPTGGTQLTAQVWTPEQMAVWAPKLNAPAVGFLTSRANIDITGAIVHSTGDTQATYPTNPAEAVKKIYANFGSTESPSTLPPNFDRLDPPRVRNAKATEPAVTEFAYTVRDALLYNLGLGASEKELDLVYENDPSFRVLPSFGVIPLASAFRKVPLNFLPNFDFTRLLHGEQFLEVHSPVPAEATLVNKATILEVLDKGQFHHPQSSCASSNPLELAGKAGLVTIASEAFNKETGALIFTGITTLFVRDAGGFSGRKLGQDFGAATALNKRPPRAPDVVQLVATEARQAALYRLSGDMNPLHVDPTIAARGGFPTPILHGLCTFGIATKLILNVFGSIKDIKVRFGGHLFPGETLEFCAWKEGTRVIFTARCVERNSMILTSAAATLAPK
ncbi:hypothetical protein RQP46_011240 [Phenoliferia psychrophenolica]